MFQSPALEIPTFGRLFLFSPNETSHVVLNNGCFHCAVMVLSPAGNTFTTGFVGFPPRDESFINSLFTLFSTIKTSIVACLSIRDSTP
jgi:hypothetical protein